jgi:DNA-directed RNA polymerase specialized sigma24 family protein
MSTRLRRRLAAANGKWSQAVEMVCYQGMSQRAAAREIGVDHKTVSYRLHQGLDLLLEWAALELGEG